MVNIFVRTLDAYLRIYELNYHNRIRSMSFDANKKLSKINTKVIFFSIK